MKVIIGVETAPRIQFTINADPDNMPDIIAINGRLLRHVGKYASPGETHSYKDVNETRHYNGETREWVQYTALTG